MKMKDLAYMIYRKMSDANNSNNNIYMYNEHINITWL